MQISYSEKFPKRIVLLIYLERIVTYPRISGGSAPVLVRASIYVTNRALDLLGQVIMRERVNNTLVRH